MGWRRRSPGAGTARRDWDERTRDTWDAKGIYTVGGWRLQLGGCCSTVLRCEPKRMCEATRERERENRENRTEPPMCDEKICDFWSVTRRQLSASVVQQDSLFHSYCNNACPRHSHRHLSTQSRQERALPAGRLSAREAAQLLLCRWYACSRRPLVQLAAPQIARIWLSDASLIRPIVPPRCTPQERPRPRSTSRRRALAIPFFAAR